jgi:hypothetical protein
LPGAGSTTPRAQGGPVTPGRAYLVGEKGPEVVSFGSRGYVHPNKGNSAPLRLVVAPSPYFDVTVDRRAVGVAAPMAAHAAMAGASGAVQHQSRRGRRNFYSAA